MTARYQEFAAEQDLPGMLRQLAVRTVIIDIEPLVAIWDTSADALDRGISRVLEQLRTVPSLAVVCFATNSARTPSAAPELAGVRVIYLASARKPVRTARYRDLPRPGAVVGDQVATDGILARRLSYTFLHYRHPLAGAPVGPRLMNGGGQLARPVVFGRRRPPPGPG